VNGNRIALDTAPAIGVLNAAMDLPDWLTPHAEVYLPVPVVAELRFGALNSQRAAQNIQRVDQLVSKCVVLPINTSTAEVYAKVRLQLKHNGKPIPENDLRIAALCIEHGIPLASTDDHFAHVEGLDLIRS